MHQKKSEVQIGTESTGVSSDFNPTLRHKHQQQSPKFHFSPHISSDPNYITNFPTNPPKILIDPKPTTPQNDPNPTPHKRPLITQNHPPNRKNLNPIPISKSPTLSHSLSRYPFKSHKLPAKKLDVAAVLRRLRRARVHLRCLLLLSLPFYFFLLSRPTRHLLLDSFAVAAFAAALLLSLNLATALPRLPSVRSFLPKTLLGSSTRASPLLPVFWSIGPGQKTEKLSGAGGCFVQVYSNGDVYEGEFHKGKCTGSGVYYYKMSGRYEGDWVDGKYDGYGVETWARGSRYRGQYRGGLRHGFGVYRFYTGDVYGGEWANGQSHGCGIHTCGDGSRFVGEFKWGVKHGVGHYHFRNGDVYAGEYFADKMHGFGMYRFASGHRYEGAWHEGKRQGLGMYTFRDGETQSGHWNNGILDVPSTQHTTYPVSPVAVYHSRVLNTVQEVRRAAEKAYDVAKVDERVNRAVAAANRAANAARVAAVKAVQNQLR